MLVEPNGPSNPVVSGAIRHAAKVTGANFQYLVATAQVESNLNSTAANPSSSARGLFQFIEQTWLSTLKEQGSALGYGRYAEAIVRTPNGQYAVGDLRNYDKVMQLREDPTANAVMAGAFTRANAGKLAGALGRKPTEGELYIAHFLGPNGAGRLINMAQASPHTNALEMFPGPASRNPSIFYDRQGRPNSVAEVYHVLVNRYATARAGSAAPAAPQVAAFPAPTQPAPATLPRPMVAPDLAQLASAYASTGAPQAADPPPATFTGFHGLFRSSNSPEAVAPVVSALWGAAAAPAPTGPTVLPETTDAPTDAAPAAGASATPSKPTPLDLFQDQAPDVRALFRGRV